MTSGLQNLSIDRSVRNFKKRLSKDKHKFAFFLGAGCSVSSGIPTSKVLVSQWLKQLYKEETGKDVYDDAADPKVKELYRKTQKKEWADNNRIRRIAAKALLEGFWPSVKGKKVFRFEYADDGGEGVFEHGDIFKSLPHIRISKH